MKVLSQFFKVDIVFVLSPSLSVQIKKQTKPNMQANQQQTKDVRGAVASPETSAHYSTPKLPKKLNINNTYGYMSLLSLFLPLLDFSENSDEIFLLHTKRKKQNPNQTRNLLSV